VIDHRQITFDPSKIQDVTLVQDQYLGLGIIANVQGGHVIASLSPESMFEVNFLKTDEGPGPRFFIPGCELWFDPLAIGDHKKDPPLGCLIAARPGISLMVKPPRSEPSPLRLTGDPIQHAYQGICITRWRLQLTGQFGKPSVLYEFEYGRATKAEDEK